MKKQLERTDLIYPELSYKIIGILFEVYNDMGAGYSEKHYQKAVANAFKENNLSFKEQLPVEVKYKNEKIGLNYLDFLVEDKIVLELKRGEHFSRKSIDQAYSYLRATNFKLAIIANFRAKSLTFKRVVNLN